MKQKIFLDFPKDEEDKKRKSFKRKKQLKVKQKSTKRSRCRKTNK